MTQNTTLTAWIGIDVSKDKLDACLLRENDKSSSMTFENTPKGFTKLLAWGKRNSAEAHLRFALEATGAYSNALAEFLVESQEYVSVLNPALVKHAGISYGFLNRTDKTAAMIIALFCKKEQPALWRRASPEVCLLVALVRRREMFLAQRVQEKNRLSNPRLP